MMMAAVGVTVHRRGSYTVKNTTKYGGYSKNPDIR